MHICTPGSNNKLTASLVLASSAVDLGFESQSDQSKDYKNLYMLVLRRKNKD